jgi:hypothetical protein
LSACCPAERSRLAAGDKPRALRCRTTRSLRAFFSVLFGIMADPGRDHYDCLGDYSPLPLRFTGKIVLPVFLSAFLTSAVVIVVACGGGYQRPVPPTPIPDPRLALAEPVAVPRVGERGAPVDCSLRIANNSGTTLNRVILACELLDADGVPVGTGLGTAQNIPNGQSRSIRTVVYGVRNFATARALVTSATFAGEGSKPP